MSFASPAWLLALAIVPLALIGYVVLQRRSSRYTVSYSNLGVLATVTEHRRDWKRHVPAALVLASLAVLAIALARPEVTMAAAEERASVVLVVDVSRSMLAEDVEPTRLDAARDAIERFLDETPDGLRVGIVAFSDEAQVIATPTTDEGLLRASLETLYPGFGTAIGDALGRGVELAESSLADPETGEVETTTESGEALASIVMLSDGFQTRGALTPEQGAQLAVGAGIPVYTVALGTDEGMIEVERFGLTQEVPVPPDRETLASIAESTGGVAYDARDAERLADVYGGLGSSLGRTDEVREVTWGFVAVGAGLLAAAALLGALRAPALP